MKKLCLLAFALLLCSSLAYAAETVSTAELKTTLIDSIKDYLSSQTPKLEKAELKDLIVIYLSTKGDTADLSGNGIFSGKKFIDVYNKAKGVAVCTGTCKPNACNTYTNCALLSTGTCTSGLNCCSGDCIPQDAEILPWGLGIGQLHIVYGAVGWKKTYIIRVNPGTKIARASFYAYWPSSIFQATFTCLPGYKYGGMNTFTTTIRYPGDFDLYFDAAGFTPIPSDGFVPPGDYIVEILWIGSGPIMIGTVYK